MVSGVGQREHPTDVRCAVVLLSVALFSCWLITIVSLSSSLLWYILTSQTGVHGGAYCCAHGRYYDSQRHTDMGLLRQPDRYLNLLNKHFIRSLFLFLPL